MRVWGLGLAVLLALVLGQFAAATPASAQATLYYVGPGGSCANISAVSNGVWDTTSPNWCTGAGGSKVAWTNGSIARFEGNQAPNVTVSGNVTAHSLHNHANYLTILDNPGDGVADTLTLSNGALTMGDTSCAFGYNFEVPLVLPNGMNVTNGYLNLPGAHTFQTNVSNNCDIRVIQNGEIGSGNYTGTLEVRSSSWDVRFEGNAAQEQTVSGTITGAGGLLVAGSHRVILEGTNTYSAPTEISSSGRLQVDSSTPAVSPVSVTSAGRLGGTGTVLGPTTFNTNGTLQPGSVLSELYNPTITGDVGVLTTANLSLGASTGVRFNLGEVNVVGGTYNDRVQVNGNLVLDGSLLVTRTTGGNLLPGVYRLFDYTGTLTDNGLAINGTVFGTMNGRAVYRFFEYSSFPAGGPYYGYIDTSTANQVNLVIVKPITGTVFEDMAADLLADGIVGDAGNAGIGGVTVRLFSGGVVATSAMTASDGSYTLFADAYGTYHVQVDAPTATASGTTGLLGAEQTYASVGVGHGGTAGGTGYGVLCVSGAPPTYTNSGATVTTASSVNPANGACYGGRRGGVDDSSTTTLDNNEHVTRVIVDANDITGVDFGFSFNAVTNVNDGGQGTLRRFINNANSISGGNEMRFVPAVATNQAGGGSTWWRVSPTSLLPIITGASTVIDGTAYSREDGTTALDFNPVTLGTGGTVGLSAIPLAQLDGPELEIKVTGGTGLESGLDIQGANSVVRNTAVSGFGNGTVGGTPAQIRILNTSNVLVENSLLGSATANSFVAPTGAEISDSYGLISITNSPGTIIRNNLIGFSSGLGILLDGSTNVTIEGNEIVGAPYQSSALDGMSASNNISGLMFRANRVADNQGTGIELWISEGDATITENTSVGNGLGHATTNVNDGGILVGSSSGPSLRLVTNNILTGNGAGINVFTNANDTRVQISRNMFSGNSRNAIDLNNDGVSTATATAGATCPPLATANGGILRPQITNAGLSGTDLTVSGTYCSAGTYTLEFYKAAAGAGDTGADGLAAGEGFEYIGSLAGLTGGTFTNQTLPVPGTVSLAIGDSVTAIVIREDGAATQGNTSEFSANEVIAETAIDYGDAPAPYPTLEADDGARHLTGSDLFLGTLEGDPDPDGQPSATAEGDDSNDTSGTAAGNDEDGVTLPAEFVTGTSTDITVVASQPGMLNAWIDWNADGDWLDADEQVATDLPLVAGSNTVTIAVPPDLVTATSFARFRFDSAGGLSFTGMATDGEVEDYQVFIAGHIDYGDAPNSYATTLASDGARHVIPTTPTLYLGQTPPDPDDGTIAGDGALGDDQDGTSDEDGVILPNAFVPGENADISVWVTGSGLLNAWIDWDGSGAFDPSEQVTTEMPVTGGALVLNIPVPAGANPGTTHARFRLCSTGGECSAVTGLAFDGEVEDYALVIGDTMTVSGTVFEDNGAAGGTAHDGTQDAGEAPLAGITVEARDNGTNALLATAVTDANGNYSLALPGSAAGTQVRIAPVASASLLPVSENPGTPNAMVNPSTTDGQIVFTPLVGTPVADVDFGYVQAPSLTLDRTLTMAPGSAVLIAHTYTSFTAGEVTFTLQNAVLNPASAFAGTLYLDADCSGAIEAGEAVVSGPVTVADGDKVCLLVRVQASSGAPAASTMEYDIVADTALSGSTVTHQVLNHDQVTVTEGATLELVKRARNITQGTGFTTSNAAGPGDVLEYQIIFTNPAAEIARNVTIHDQTPAWTTLAVGAGATVAVTPPGMSCSVVAPAGGGSDGYNGQIEWSCTGDLAPGGQGEVRFQVQIDQ